MKIVFQGSRKSTDIKYFSGKDYRLNIMMLNKVKLEFCSINLTYFLVNTYSVLSTVKFNEIFRREDIRQHYKRAIIHFTFIA